MPNDEQILKLQEQIEKLEYLVAKIRDEGFHYCFIHYSDFKDIEDSEFHELREKYVDTTKKLEVFITTKLESLTSELEDLY